MKRMLIASIVLASVVLGCGPSAGQLREQGVMQFQAGAARQAEDSFRQVLKIEPADPDALYYLGRIYQARGEYARAIAYYEMAIDADPGHKSAHVYLRRAEEESGLRSETIRFVP